MLHSDVGLGVCGFHVFARVGVGIICFSPRFRVDTRSIAQAGDKSHICLFKDFYSSIVIDIFIRIYVSL